MGKNKWRRIIEKAEELVTTARMDVDEDGARGQEECKIVLSDDEESN